MSSLIENRLPLDHRDLELLLLEFEVTVELKDALDATDDSSVEYPDSDVSPLIKSSKIRVQAFSAETSNVFSAMYGFIQGVENADGDHTFATSLDFFFDSLNCSTKSSSRFRSFSFFTKVEVGGTKRVVLLYFILHTESNS